MIAVVPVLFVQPKTDWSHSSDAPVVLWEFPIGRDLITANGWCSFWFFTWMRRACIPFNLLGGYVRYWWRGAVRRLARPAGADTVVLRAEHLGERADDYAGHGGDGLWPDGSLYLLEVAETSWLDARPRRRRGVGAGAADENDLDYPLRAVAGIMASLAGERGA